MLLTHSCATRLIHEWKKLFSCCWRLLMWHDSFMCGKHCCHVAVAFLCDKTHSVESKLELDRVMHHTLFTECDASLSMQLRLSKAQSVIRHSIWMQGTECDSSLNLIRHSIWFVTQSDSSFNLIRHSIWFVTQSDSSLNLNQSNKVQSVMHHSIQLCALPLLGFVACVLHYIVYGDCGCSCVCVYVRMHVHIHEYMNICKYIKVHIGCGIEGGRETRRKWESETKERERKDR